MGIALSKARIIKYAAEDNWSLKHCPVCDKLVPVGNEQTVEQSKHWKIMHGGSAEDIGFDIIRDFVPENKPSEDGERSGQPCPKCKAEMAYYPAGSFADDEDVLFCERCNYTEETGDDSDDGVIDCLRCGGDMLFDREDDEWICSKCGLVEKDPDSCPNCSETIDFDNELGLYWCPNCAQYLPSPAAKTTAPTDKKTKDCPRCDSEMFQWAGEQNTYWVCDHCGKIDDVNAPTEKLKKGPAFPTVFSMYERRNKILANEITPQIWLGDVVNGWLMRDRKTGKPFDAILNVSQHNYTPPPDVEYSHLPIDEYSRGPQASLERQGELAEAAQQLEKWVSEGKNVYVHCSEGMNRSPSVIAAYLYKQKMQQAQKGQELLPSGKPTQPPDQEGVYDDVLQHIQKKRSIAMPYGEMEDALRAYLKLPRLAPRYPQTLPSTKPKELPAGTRTQYRENDVVTVPIDMGRKRVPGKVLKIQHPSLDEAAKGKRPEYVVSFEDNGANVIDSFPYEALRPTAPTPVSSGHQFSVGDLVMVPWDRSTAKGEIVSLAGPNEYLVQIKDRKSGYTSLIKFEEDQIAKLRKQKQRRYFDPDKNIMQSHPKFPPPGGVEKRPLKPKKKVISRRGWVHSMATKLAELEMPRRGGKNIIARFLRRAITEPEMFNFYAAMQLPPAFYAAFPKWERYAQSLVEKVSKEYAQYLEQLSRTEANETLRVMDNSSSSEREDCDHTWMEYNSDYHQCDNCGTKESHEDFEDDDQENHHCNMCGFSDNHDFNRNHYCYTCGGDYDHNWAITDDQEYTCVNGEDDNENYALGCGQTSETIELDQNAPFFGDYYGHNHQHEFSLFQHSDYVRGSSEGIRCHLCGRAYLSDETAEQLEMDYPNFRYEQYEGPSKEQQYTKWKEEERAKNYKLHESDPSLHEWRSDTYYPYSYSSFTEGYVPKVGYRCTSCNRGIEVAIIPSEEWNNTWPKEGLGPDTYGNYASLTGEPPVGIVVKSHRAVEQKKKELARQNAPHPAPHAQDPRVQTPARPSPRSTRPPVQIPEGDTESPAATLYTMTKPRARQLSFRSITAAPSPNPLKQKWDRREPRRAPRKKKETPRPNLANIDTSNWFDFNVQDPEGGKWIPWSVLRSQYRPSEWRMLEKALIDNPEAVITGLTPAGGGGRLRETFDRNRISKFKNMVEIKKRLVAFTPNQIRQALKRLEKYQQYLRTDADDIFLTITGLKNLFDNKKPDEFDAQTYRDIQPELRQAWDIYVKVLSKKDPDMAEFYSRNNEPPKPEWGAEATVETNQVQIAKGTGSSPGKATGRVATSAASAIEMAGQGRPVILVRPETTPEDIAAMKIAAAFLTAFGGPTAHAAIVARQMGKPCVVNAGFQLTDGGVMFGERKVEEGDVISLDGSSGLVSVREKVEGQEEELETPAPDNSVHVETEEGQNWDDVFQEILEMEKVLKDPDEYEYDSRSLQSMDLFDLAQVFQKRLHDGAYGGPRWALAAMRAKQLQEVTAKDMPWRYKGMIVDQINTLQHNTGNIFANKPWPGKPSNWIDRVLDTKGSEHAMQWIEEAKEEGRETYNPDTGSYEKPEGNSMLTDETKAMLRDYRMWARRSGYPSLYGTDISHLSPQELKALKEREIADVRRRRNEESYKWSFAGPGRVALLKFGKTVIAFHKIAGARLAISEDGVQDLSVPESWRGRGIARELAEAMRRVDYAG